MRLPQRGPDRPPQGVADPSTRPVVAGLLAVASPEDSLSHGGEVQRDGGGWWFLPDRDAPATSGWCADPRLLPVDVWRSSASAYVGARLSGGPLAGRLPCKRSTPPWCRSANHRYASGCLETARRLACAVIRASAHVAPRAVLG